MNIAIINGPNLAHLGRREVAVYGEVSMDSMLEALKARYPQVAISYWQSNHEGDLIDYLYEAEARGVVGVILNAGGYTHTSVALLDAVRAISIPVIEVHISNIYAREPYRHHSMISQACRGVIAGLGLDGYRLALEALLEQTK